MAEIIAGMEQPRVASAHDFILINDWADAHKAKSLDRGWLSNNLDPTGVHILIPFEKEPASSFVRCIGFLKITGRNNPEEVWVDVLESELKSLHTAIEARESGLTDRLEV